MWGGQILIFKSLDFRFHSSNLDRRGLVPALHLQPLHGTRWRNWEDLCARRSTQKRAIQWRLGRAPLLRGNCFLLFIFDFSLSQESSNSWHGTWNMIWHRRHHACGIVKMAADDEKRLYAFGGYHHGWRQVLILTKCDTFPTPQFKGLGHLHQTQWHEWLPPRVGYAFHNGRHEVCEDGPVPLHAGRRQHAQLGGDQQEQLVSVERPELQGGEGRRRYALPSPRCSCRSRPCQQSKDKKLRRTLRTPSTKVDTRLNIFILCPSSCNKLYQSRDKKQAIFYLASPFHSCFGCSWGFEDLHCKREFNTFLGF